MGKLFEVVVLFDAPTPRFGELLPFKIEELVGGYVFGQGIPTVCLEHSRKNDAVEHDVVFADEVDEFHVIALPVAFPVCPIFQRPLTGGRNVPDRGIEPHVQYFALCFLLGERHGDAPVQVAGNGAGLQAGVEPGEALPYHMAFPGIGVVMGLAVEPSVFNPIAEPVGVFFEPEVPVLGRAEYRGFAAERRARGDEFQGRQGGSALFALIAKCFGVAALRAGTDDISVGQELLIVLVVVLLDRALFKLVALLVQFGEEPLCGFMVQGSTCSVVVVERDAQAREGLFVQGVVLVNDLLRAYAFFFGADRDGCAMLIGTAYPEHVAPHEPQVAHVDICGQVRSGQMAEVQGTIGIRQGRSDHIFLSHVRFLRSKTRR